jgi:hypothetical protein
MTFRWRGLQGWISGETETGKGSADIGVLRQSSQSAATRRANGDIPANPLSLKLQRRWKYHIVGEHPGSNYQQFHFNHLLNYDSSSRKTRKPSMNIEKRYSISEYDYCKPNEGLSLQAEGVWRYFNDFYQQTA